jgi:hypothetical protein
MAIIAQRDLCPTEQDEVHPNLWERSRTRGYQEERCERKGPEPPLTAPLSFSVLPTSKIAPSLLLVRCFPLARLGLAYKNLALVCLRVVIGFVFGVIEEGSLNEFGCRLPRILRSYDSAKTDCCRIAIRRGRGKNR